MDPTDPDFIRVLQDLTGQKELWEDFDPLTLLVPHEDGDSELASQDGSLGPPAECDDWNPNPNVRIRSAEEWAKEPESGSIECLHVVDDGTGALPIEERVKSLAISSATAEEKPIPQRDVSRLMKVKWPQTRLEECQVSKEGDEFCPWKLVTKYLGMYVGKQNAKRAADLFTPAGLHESRTWDFFYIHRPAEPYKEPHLFVPTYQFEHLLDVVNAKLDTWLTIPDGANEKNFRVVFGRGGTPRPRFLGRTTCLEEFQDLTEDFPPIHPDDSLKNTPEEDRGWFLDFLAFIDRAQEKKSKSGKNQAKRMRAYLARGRSINRVQRYLGLREGITGAKPAVPKKLDLAVPTAIKPEKSVLFVAIDIEAYEFNQQLVTEVGIAILDTNELVGVAPGEGGENWFSLIDARHIRVKENDWAVNRTHVHGCPDRFQFGESEFVPQADVPLLLRAIIEQGNNSPNGMPGAEESIISSTTDVRPVVLVFHDSHSDIKYLAHLGYDLYAARNVLEAVDTQEMNKYITRADNSSALGSVLTRLKMTSMHLHNAGNDAVYTLQIMIGLAVEKRLLSLEKHLTKGTKEQKSHVPFSDFAKSEAWSSAGEDSDGGDPEPFSFA